MRDNDCSKSSNKPTYGSLLTVWRLKAVRAFGQSNRTRHFADHLQKVWIQILPINCPVNTLISLRGYACLSEFSLSAQNIYKENITRLLACPPPPPPPEIKFFMLLVFFLLNQIKISIFSYFNKWIVNEILHNYDSIEEITYYATVLKLHYIR